jgi:hypothetical protein
MEPQNDNNRSTYTQLTDAEVAKLLNKFTGFEPIFVTGLGLMITALALLFGWLVAIKFQNPSGQYFASVLSGIAGFGVSLLILSNLLQRREAEQNLHRRMPVYSYGNNILDTPKFI